MRPQHLVCDDIEVVNESTSWRKRLKFDNYRVKFVMRAESDTKHNRNLKEQSVNYVSNLGSYALSQIASLERVQLLFTIRVMPRI